MKEIILIGSSGKMGQMIKSNIKDPYIISGMIDLKNNKIIESTPYAVIDFSSPSSTMFYAPYYISKQIPYICGTTALQDEEITILKQMVQHYDSHFRLCSSFDPDFYTIQNFLKEENKNYLKALIEEWHQINKKDIPSGVAKSFVSSLSIPNSIISHRKNINYQRHQITLIGRNKRLRINYEVLSRTIYMEGINIALSKVSLKGFYNGL